MYKFNCPHKIDGVCIECYQDAVGTAAEMLNEQQDALVSLNATIRRSYEELRAIIDNGSESMTHDDAVKELKRLMADDEEREKVEPIGYFSVNDRGYLEQNKRPGNGIPLYTHPAPDVLDVVELKHQRDKLVEALSSIRECLAAALFEGLQDRLAEEENTDVGTLYDLVTRRLLHVDFYAKAAIAKVGADKTGEVG